MIALWGGNKDIELSFWTFPGGERNVKILDPDEIHRFKAFTLRCDFRGSDDLIDMMLLVNAIRNVHSTTRIRLLIPYFPFARQDRVMTEGEPFALQVAVQIIKSCNFAEIEVWDPHSDVLSGMFEPGMLKIVPQHKLIKPLIEKYASDKRDNVCLVSPDSGALKKIYKLAKEMNLPVVEATKQRDVSTGGIVKTFVPDEIKNYSYAYIVDDICDGGKTFIELAKAIRQITNPITIELYVTHGIFSKGIDALFAGGINGVLAANPFDKNYI